MNVAIYCRVSTDEQAETGSSLDTQESACAAYALEQGWTVVAVERESASGYTLARPGLERLRQQLAQVDVLLAYDFDRLSRNQTQMAVLLDDVMTNGAAMWSVRDGALEDTAVGRFLLSARTFAAELEREKIVERTMRGKIAWASQGRVLSRPPYGYQARGQDETREFVVDDREARIVRRIYAEYASGMGALAIAKGLNEDEVPTPHHSRHWSREIVRLILARETYVGVLTWKGIRVEDAVPPIVERETWEAAQRMIATRRRVTGKQESPYLLTGVIWCAACGGRMQGDTAYYRGRQYRYYICATWHRGHGCTGNRHNAPKLEQRVIYWLNVASAISSEAKQADQRLEQAAADLAQVETDIGRNESRRQAIVEQIADQVLTGHQARAAVEQIEAERQRLIFEQQRLCREQEQVMEQREHLSSRPSELNRLREPDTPTMEIKRIITTYTERVIVTPGDPEPRIQ